MRGWTGAGVWQALRSGLTLHCWKCYEMTLTLNRTEYCLETPGSVQERWRRTKISQIWNTFLHSSSWSSRFLQTEWMTRYYFLSSKKSTFLENLTKIRNKQLEQCWNCVLLLRRWFCLNSSGYYFDQQELQIEENVLRIKKYWLLPCLMQELIIWFAALSCSVAWWQWCVFSCVLYWAINHRNAPLPLHYQQELPGTFHFIFIFQTP